MTTIIQHPRYFTSLPRDYYVAPETYEHEIDRVFKRQWLYAGHVSQVRETGDYFSRMVAGESLVFTRDGEGQVHAFYNVCRHRGSLLCDDGSRGRAKALVCPYHQWSYKMDGSLRNAPGARDGQYFDYADWGLQEALCDTHYGSIWVWLGDPAEAPNLAEVLAPGVSDVATLESLEPEKMKVAHEVRLVIDANWKLVLENFLECHHCASAHPTLSASCEVPEFFQPAGGQTEEQPFFPLRPGMKTFSVDGEWVSKKPLGAGHVERLNCGYFHVPIFVGLTLFADHGSSLDLTPLDHERTQVINQWFVHEDAVEGRDYDLDTLTKVVHVTLMEDVALTERTQRGVRSSKYVPGPNQPDREYLIESVLNNYLELMGNGDQA